MALYQVAITSVAAASGAPYTQFRGSSTRVSRVREIKISAQSSTLSAVGLARQLTANLGTASATSVGIALANDGDPAALGSLDTAWSSAPSTVPVNYLEHDTVNNVPGNGVLWTWSADAPLIVPVSAGLIFWNWGGGGGSALNVKIKFDE
jgi:hypothetical protein